MKRLCIILVGVVMVWGLPGADSALGFLGMEGTPALGGLPAGYPINVAYTGTDSGIMGGFSLNLGWLEQRDGSIWALERPTSTGTATWPLKGFWVYATEELTFDRRFGLLVSSGFFIPRHMNGTWIPRPNGTTSGFDIPSYDWQFVDGIFKAGVSGGFDVLAGFRWDRTSTRVDYSDNTSDDYVLNSYLPLIGAQVTRRFSDSSLLVRLLGSPLVYGTLKYHFWDRLGYAEFGDFRVNSKSSYFEILADYQFKLQSCIRAGGFVKWNWLSVRTGSHNLSGLTTESVAWAVDIKSWVIGGVVSVDFGSPFHYIGL